MLHEDTCKFFNGSINTHCEAGVAYRDVTPDPDDIDGSAFRRPCIDWELWNERKGKVWDNDGQKQNWERRGHCPKRTVPTAEEVVEDEARCEAVFKEWSENITNNICPTHKVPITKKQVGRCVYAEPCGCRLYQGKA